MVNKYEVNGKVFNMPIVDNKINTNVDNDIRNGVYYQAISSEK